MKIAADPSLLCSSFASFRPFSPPSLTVLLCLLEPMTRLLSYFKHPYHLIEKRRDKKLDFDSFQRQLKKTKDPEKKRAVEKDLEAAQKNFHGG